jgi:NAD(P)-dependent dehydrogenase (short-subunit alcohol dehydrogenase family)
MADAVGAAGAGKGLDLCVANAGTARYEDFLRSDECSWEALWRANVQSVLVTLQAAARDMRKHGRGGRLLVNASVTGVRGAAGMPAYSATKGALLALVEALALDLAPHRIFVNALVPGVTDTELLRETIRSEALAQATSEAALLDEAKHRIPLGRLARPYDIAQLALFLLNDTSSYITGTQVRIDGGLLLGH